MYFYIVALQTIPRLAYVDEIKKAFSVAPLHHQVIVFLLGVFLNYAHGITDYKACAKFSGSVF